MKLLGDAPGQRTIIGQAHDQPALACHDAAHRLNPLFHLRFGFRQFFIGGRFLDRKLGLERPLVKLAP